MSRYESWMGKHMAEKGFEIAVDFNDETRADSESTAYFKRFADVRPWLRRERKRSPYFYAEKARRLPDPYAY
jgi:hypothetical protein